MTAVRRHYILHCYWPAGSDDEVITQPLTFVATANAISYCKAHPVFVDVDRPTLGLDPEQLAEFLKQYGNLKADGCCYNLATGRRISACVPMHTFGHPCRIDQVVDICRKYCIPVVEDAAEALGSFYCGRHVGLFGDNAAVGCAQMESFSHVLENKRQTARMYYDFFQKLDISFVSEPENAQSNYLLNAIVLKDRQNRDQFLEFGNQNGVQVRPVWTLMNHLPMYRNCQTTVIDNAQWLEDRVVNIPSSVRKEISIRGAYYANKDKI